MMHIIIIYSRPFITIYFLSWHLFKVKKTFSKRYKYNILFIELKKCIYIILIIIYIFRLTVINYPPLENVYQLNEV